LHQQLARPGHQLRRVLAALQAGAHLLQAAVQLGIGRIEPAGGVQQLHGACEMTAGRFLLRPFQNRLDAGFERPPLQLRANGGMQTARLPIAGIELQHFTHHGLHVLELFPALPAARVGQERSRARPLHPGYYRLGILEHFVDALIAQITIRLEGAADQPLQRLGQRLGAGQELGADSAEGVDVTERIGREAAVQLFRRGIWGVVFRLADQAHDAEIVKNRRIIGADRDAGWPESDRTQSAVMRRAQTVRHLPKNCHLSQQRHRGLRANGRAKTAFVEILHGCERQSFVLTQLVDRDQVLMTQLGCNRDLAAEQIGHPPVAGVSQELEGNGPAGVAIQGAKHLDQGTVSSLRVDFVLPDARLHVVTPRYVRSRTGLELGNQLVEPNPCDQLRLF
jgi:hypothetical protein